MPTTYAIPNGATVMAATTYTGNGTTNAITNGGNNTTGVTFQPDFVWMKNRTNAYYHGLYDSVRGTGTSKSLYSNTTEAEGTNSTNQNLVSFDTSGFTLGSTSSTNAINTSGSSLVAWQWKAGGTAVSNTAGSITSSVSANTTAGFSVVTYTGTGSAATVGHGLGVAPSMYIVKSRNGSADWGVYHKSLGASNALFLNLTSGSTAGSVWNNTAPTSSVFSVGSGSFVNTNGVTYVAYCWAEVAGYSKFGSYTGNGSTDGPFVYLGFRPRFVMIKLSSASGTNWEIWDSSRNTYNITDLLLLPSSSNAESTYSGNYSLDFLSNGFKIRGSGSGLNDSGQTLIYAAFAENPFKYSNAR
jgi:hypothetical protein